MVKEFKVKYYTTFSKLCVYYCVSNVGVAF